ncbi:HU family DNA-binding protein [Microcoleus sp. herbarium14]|uniref:HU family DNA-binding protein n=1 Tax=Microcoleus sp. herbarium14 TaxID=3055439 RepID=UPI002FD59B56
MTTLIDYVKSSTGFAESTIAAVMNSATTFLSTNLRNGEEAKLEGLGTFKATDRPERPGRNPKTGESITIKASRKAKLTFAKSFLASIQPDPNAVVPVPVVESSIPVTVAIEIPPIPADLMPPSMVIPPIPADLLSEVPELLWQIKAPDDSFIQVATSELSGWGVSATTPVYSPATGWKLAGKVPELAGIVG